YLIVCVSLISVNQRMNTRLVFLLLLLIAVSIHHSDALYKDMDAQSIPEEKRIGASDSQLRKLKSQEDAVPVPMIRDAPYVKWG
ncbi:hypothetical protein AC249_AIPGENE25334, partial [Exaiptasia diaphana]